MEAGDREPLGACCQASTSFRAWTTGEKMPRVKLRFETAAIPSRYSPPLWRYKTKGSFPQAEALRTSSLRSPAMYKREIDDDRHAYSKGTIVLHKAVLRPARGGDIRRRNHPCREHALRLPDAIDEFLAASNA